MGRTALIAFLLLVITASTALAATAVPGPMVSALNNKHNLRSSNTGVFYKAAVNPADRRNDEICIFCHTPHNASPATALWGRKPTVTSSFGHYTSNTLVIQTLGATSGYNEPTGSSRLCLSCHDGATALGAVLNGPEIVFDAAKQTIAARNSPAEYNVFNPNQGANDATQHHHPISFKYDAAVKSAINIPKAATPYKFPWEGAPYDVPQVKLDRNGYMQCTTCHNPHQDMSGTGSSSPDANTDTPFWVLGTDKNSRNLHDTVCLACHSLTEFSNPIANPPNPYLYP